MVQLPEYASAKLQRELGAFARYCIGRIERELGECGLWRVTLTRAGREYSSYVAVRDGRAIVEDRGFGLDGTLAVWEAMCRIEQRLRDLRRGPTAAA